MSDLDFYRQVVDKTPPEPIRDLYAKAIAEGQKMVHAYAPDDSGRVLDAAYWTARYAARETARALLDEAKRLGLTNEQQEALRVVAAQVAYD